MIEGVLHNLCQIEIDRGVKLVVFVHLFSTLIFIFIYSPHNEFCPRIWFSEQK